MRPSARRLISLACCAGTALVWSGCQGKKVTEYVPGISTQVTVPRDLKAIRVEVNVGGSPQFCQAYQVYQGHVLLPRSLGNFANSDATLGEGPVLYTVAGVDTDDLSRAIFADCNAVNVGQDDLRILRKSRQPFVQDETLFLPMPLKFSCYDVNCPDIGGQPQTCKGGKCVAVDLTPDEQKQLVPYSQDLIDGTGASCFSTSICMALATPAPAVDATKCIYAVPASKDAPPLVPGATNPAPPSGDGVNVELSYDGGLVHEVLDLDVSEGFFIPDPTKPQVFQLAPGLCDLVKGTDSTTGKPTPHRITGIRASGTCQSKTIFQPICADDQNKAMGLDPNGVVPNPPPIDACSSLVLSPAPADLMVVVDDSPQNKVFFDQIKNSAIDPQNQDTLVAVAVKGALADPAFENTQIGLIYTGTTPDVAGPPGSCLDTGPADKALANASVARDAILADLSSHAAQGTRAEVGGALKRAYAELAKDPSAIRKAVLVLGNSDDLAGHDRFSKASPTCTADVPATLAQTAASNPDPTKAILTYAMQLTSSPDPTALPTPANPARGAATSTWGADILAFNGAPPNGRAAYKAQEGAAKFQDIVNYLATCIYAVPGGASAPIAGDTVAYIDPLANVQTTLSNNTTCTAPGVGTGAGWGKNKDNVFLCPDSCTGYRTVLAQATKFAALYQQPALSIPVFSYRSPDKTTGQCN